MIYPVGMSSEPKHYPEIGARVRAVREVFGGGVSAARFAKDLEVSVAQYRHWERGSRRIPIEYGQLYWERFGVTLDFLYLGRSETLMHNVATALLSSPSLIATSKSSDKPDR